MGIIEAIIYGIVQGLTEFLPISSNAHLRIVPALLHWDDPGAAFTAIIQLGTVAAVILYFGKDLGAAFMAWWNSLTGKKNFDKDEARIGWAVFIGTLPVVALGLAFHSKIETSLRSLNIIAAALIVMGVGMLVAEKTSTQKRKIKDVNVKDGLIVGLWQCLALIPGMSRSGSTISGALFQGFDRVAAARFSFLLSIPSVAGAGIYESYKELKETKAEAAIAGAAHFSWTPVIVATIVSFIVGYASIAFFMSFLQRRGIGPFVWYRIALGILILFLVQRGIIDENAGAKTPPPPKAEAAAQLQAPVILSGVAMFVRHAVEDPPHRLGTRSQESHFGSLARVRRSFDFGPSVGRPSAQDDVSTYTAQPPSHGTFGNA